GRRTGTGKFSRVGEPASPRIPRRPRAPSRLGHGTRPAGPRRCAGAPHHARATAPRPSLPAPGALPCQPFTDPTIQPGRGRPMARRRSFRVPHTLVLLCLMIVAALVLTYVLPAGRYERVENEHGRMQVVAGTFERIPDAPLLSPLTVFTAIPRGLAAAAEIIFFVFIIGGAFAVLRSTGAVDAFLGAALRRLGHRPIWLILG